MKVKEMKNVWNKMGPTGCKWSSLSAKDSKTPKSPPFWVHFPILLSQGANLPIFSQLILITLGQFCPKCVKF